METKKFNYIPETNQQWPTNKLHKIGVPRTYFHRETHHLGVYILFLFSRVLR